LANINLNVVALGDFNQLRGQLDRLNAQVVSLNSALAATNTKLSTSELKKLTDHLDNAIKSTGLYTSQTVQLSSAAQHLGERIQKNNTTWRDFKYALKGVNDESTLYNKLGQRQVAMHRSLLTSMGDMVRVYTAHNVNMSDAGNKSAVFTEALRAQNAVLTQGATKVINWGKNMQWAGRQLTAGLAMPVVLLSTQLAKMYNDVDKNLTNLAKVYGVGLTKPTEAMLAKVRTDVLGLAKELAQTLGISASEVTDIAAQFAAAGLTGQELISATSQAARMVVLGETDKQEAIKATIALQTAYKLNTEDLSEAVNFFNAAQAATSTSMSDLIEAVPKVGPVVRGLGGSYKDMVAIMTALKEGGVPAGEAANAIKTSMGRLINPTKAASEKLKGFGIDINGIVSKNAGNLTGMLTDLQKSLDTLAPLERQRAIAELFGKFQYARMAALMDNFNRSGSQSAKVMEMMGMSAAQLASIADDQTKKIQQSASGRFKIAVETLKNDLLPVGEMALGKFTQLVEKINELANTMQNLPAPIKAAMKAFAIATIFAGPLIMITGLMGNFFGFVLKGLIPIRALFAAITHGVNPMGVLGKKFELLSAEEIAARNSSKLFSDQALKSASSVDIMTAAIEKQIQALQQYEATLGGMGTQNVMGEATKSATAGMTDKESRDYIVKHMGASGNLTKSESGSGLFRTDPSNAILTGNLSVPAPSGDLKIKNQMTALNSSLTSGGAAAFNPTGKDFSQFASATGMDFSKLAASEAAKMQKAFAIVEEQFRGFGLSYQQLADIADITLPTMKKATQLELEKAATRRLILAEDKEYLIAEKKLKSVIDSSTSTEQDKIKAEKEFTALIKRKIATDTELSALKPTSKDNDATLRAKYDQIQAINANTYIQNAETKQVKNFQDKAKRAAQALQNTTFNIKGYGKASAEGQHHIIATSDASNNFVNKIVAWAKSVGKATAATDAATIGMEQGLVADKIETSATQKLTAAEIEAAAAVKIDAEAHLVDAAGTLAGEGGAPGKGKGGLRGMLGKPGVKFGAGMALGIGGSMLAGMIPEGSAAKQPATMAAQGAGLGMMFGPEGALIGAALGALAGGFMELNHQAQVAAAGLRSTLGISEDEFKALGLEIPKITSALPDFNASTDAAKTAIDNFKKAIDEAADTSEIKAFVGKLKEAGADQTKIDALLQQKGTAMALAGIKKEDVQTAIAAYMESAGITRTNFNVSSLYGENGRANKDVGFQAVTGALSGVGMTAGQSAINPTINAGRFGPQNNPQMNGINNAAAALAPALEGLISLNTPLKDFFGTISEINNADFTDTTAGGQMLNKAISDIVGDNPQLQELNNKLKDKTPAERMMYLRAAVEGLGGSIADLPKLTTIEVNTLFTQKILQDTANASIASGAERIAAQTPDGTSGSSGSSGSSGGGSGESAHNKAIDAKIEANKKIIEQIKEEEELRKKNLALQEKEKEFAKTKLGLQNQIRMALAEGNYLQAAELQQQMDVNDAKKAADEADEAATKIAEDRIKALEAANKLLESQKTKGGSGGGSGGGSTATTGTMSGKSVKEITDAVDVLKDHTLKAVDASNTLYTSYDTGTKSFVNSPEVKAMNDKLKDMGFNSQEIADINAAMYQSYEPTVSAITKSTEFSTLFKEKMKGVASPGEAGFDPGEYARAAKSAGDSAVAELQAAIKRGKYVAQLKLTAIKYPHILTRAGVIDYESEREIRKSSNAEVSFYKMGGLVYKKGGAILGPGNGMSDSIPAMLSNGEFVMNAASVSKYGIPMMSAINKMNFPGAIVPSSPVSSSSASGSTNGTISAVFNISGAGNPEEVARVVMKKLSMMSKKQGSVTTIG
jgi:TP901 family phage tail tape measure protein